MTVLELACKALDLQGGTCWQVAPHLSAGAPYSRRLYGGKLYYQRDILCNGAVVGRWTDWATLWRKDWKAIQSGELTRVHFPATGNYKVLIATDSMQWAGLIAGADYDYCLHIAKQYIDHARKGGKLQGRNLHARVVGPNGLEFGILAEFHWTPWDCLGAH